MKKGQINEQSAPIRTKFAWIKERMKKLSMNLEDDRVVLQSIEDIEKLFFEYEKNHKAWKKVEDLLTATQWKKLWKNL